MYNKSVYQDLHIVLFIPKILTKYRNQLIFDDKILLIRQKLYFFAPVERQLRQYL